MAVSQESDLLRRSWVYLEKCSARKGFVSCILLHNVDLIALPQGPNRDGHPILVPLSFERIMTTMRLVSLKGSKDSKTWTTVIAESSDNTNGMLPFQWTHTRSLKDIQILICTTHWHDINLADPQSILSFTDLDSFFVSHYVTNRC